MQLTMRSFLLSVLVCSFVICQQAQAIIPPPAGEIIESCLVENNLTLEHIGVKNISELKVDTENPFVKVNVLPTEVRNCVAACIFQKSGLKIENGKLILRVPGAEDKGLQSDYLDQTCGVYKDNICHVGGCLIDIALKQ